MNNTPSAKKTPAYRSRISTERSDDLYVRILNQLTKGKRYRDPNYTARRLAVELKTNTRYISAVVANRTGDNYNALVNSFRLRDARKMLRSPRMQHLTAEEIGLLAGFSSRQAFYLAFSRAYGNETPASFRASAKLESPSSEEEEQGRAVDKRRSKTGQSINEEVEGF